MKGTKGSHFVWQRYLNSFASDQNIYVKDIQGNRIWATKTENVAKKTNIYTLQKKISEYDKECYKKIFKDVNLSCDYLMILDSLVCFLNNDVSITLKNFHPYIQKALSEFVNNAPLQDDYNKNQEKLFTFYEERFKGIYEALLKKDASFYNNQLDNIGEAAKCYMGSYRITMLTFLQIEMAKFVSKAFEGYEELKGQRKEIYNELNEIRKKIDERVRDIFDFVNNKGDNIFNFMQFFITQSLRTVKHQKQFFEKTKEYKNINAEAIYTLALHINTYFIASRMICRGYRIVFLVNQTKYNFITSDQPIINTYENFDLNSELYYPLAPDLAMLFTNRECYQKVDEIGLKEIDVMEYNKLLAKNADRFIYAITEVELFLINE